MIDTIDSRITGVARAAAAAGGRALLVGGYVRDRLLGVASKDYDVEIFGLSPDAVADLLSDVGELIQVGRAFGVFRIKGIEADFSLPRRDSKSGSGHRGFDIAFDPDLDFAEASRRRDLTVNSIGLDPLSGEILDPHGGRRDLERGVLRATDAEHFAEDPLRGLRTAQFAARLDMLPDEELTELCAELDLGELPPERIYAELRKLLLKATRPSLGFAFLERARLLRCFPELDALRGVPQDPQWHPEGDVWVHTLMALDQAARLRGGAAEDGRQGDEADDLALMIGTLCHDLGKPLTTETTDGRIRSPNHCRAGLAPTETLLARWRAPHRLVERVLALVDNHLAPAQFVGQRAGPRGYRKLSRNLERAGVSLALLTRVARADHLGRTTEEALRGEFSDGDRFLERAAELAVEQRGPVDVVQGRHLIARGLVPGPGFAPILERCREIQDEAGETDPASILDRVLGSG